MVCPLVFAMRKRKIRILGVGGFMIFCANVQTWMTANGKYVNFWSHESKINQAILLGLITHKTMITCEAHAHTVSAPLLGR